MTQAQSSLARLTGVLRDKACSSLMLLVLCAPAYGQALSVSPTTLPTPVQGNPYSINIVASNGTPPYTLTQVAGSLPTGLTLGSSSLSGTPSSSSPYYFVLSLSDFVGAELFLGVSTLAVSAGGAAVSQSLAPPGSVGPYSINVVSGSLPPGMSVNASGVLVGSGTTPGSYAASIQVIDSHGRTLATSLNITVSAAQANTHAIPALSDWSVALLALLLFASVKYGRRRKR